MTSAYAIYFPLVNVIGVQHIQQNVENEPLCRDLCNIIYESRFMLKKKGSGKQEAKSDVEIQHFSGPRGLGLVCESAGNSHDLVSGLIK